jgi:IS5 family transposase
MKAHIDVDADSGLEHKVVGTTVNVNVVTQAHALVHAEELMCWPTQASRAWTTRQRPKASISTGM